MADDPKTFLTLAAGMVQLREMFDAAIAAGFSEDQAMRIVLETIRSAAQGGGS